MKFMNGAYILILKLNSNKNIKVGALGKIKFKKGFYCYVGSAIGNLTIEKRCKRHLIKHKKMRWHINYLRKEAIISKIVIFPSDKKIECKIAKAFLEFSDGFVTKFGSSDCKCISHLFYFKSERSLYNLIRKNFYNVKSLNLK